MGEEIVGQVTGDEEEGLLLPRYLLLTSCHYSTMKLLQLLLNIFFPCRCVSCHKSIDRGVICNPCLDVIPLHQTFFCAECHARLPNGQKICHKKSLFTLGAAGSYKNAVLKTMIFDLKFKGVRNTADPLAELLARYLANCDADLAEFIIIPLPLAKRRERERGFNQSMLIAKNLAERINLPVVENVLIRNKHTKPQTETASAAERRLNIQNCFMIADAHAIARKKILLIDDVTTSGATLGEAARILKSAGVKTIIGLAIAKA
jgi:competence protein ComFC